MAKYQQGCELCGHPAYDHHVSGVDDGGEGDSVCYTCEQAYHTFLQAGTLKPKDPKWIKTLAGKNKLHLFRGTKEN